jgi:hypothetical protein
VLTDSSQWKVAGIVALSIFSTRYPSWSRALAPKNGRVALGDWLSGGAQNVEI